jgi:hypothetical protein
VSKSTSGTGTHRARPVFATPLEMRPALPRLVDVAPGERLQLADAHPRSQRSEIYEPDHACETTRPGSRSDYRPTSDYTPTNVPASTSS